MVVGEGGILMFPIPHGPAKSMDEHKGGAFADVKIGHAMVVDGGDLIGHTLD